MGSKQCAGHVERMHLWTFRNIEIFLITVVIDLAKASLASRSDVFSSLRDDVRRMTDSCSTDVEGSSTVGAGVTTKQRFCLWGRDRQQRFWRGQDRPHYRDLLFNCWPWFFDDLIAESKAKKILKKRGNLTLEVFGRDPSSLCDNSHL